MVPTGWTPPTLASCNSIVYGLHLPNYTLNWNKVVAGTGQKYAKAKYSNTLTHDNIRQRELRCATDGQAVPGKEGCSWRKEEIIVGACNGEETKYLYVELNPDGTYHGRPITPQLLQKMGVPWRELG